MRATLRPSSSETASCSPSGTGNLDRHVGYLGHRLFNLTNARAGASRSSSRTGGSSPQLWPVTDFARLARACRVSMMATISPVEAWVRPPGCAPRRPPPQSRVPCSPARAASMAALSANRLVWSAMPRDDIHHQVDLGGLFLQFTHQVARLLHLTSHPGDGIQGPCTS